MGTCFYVRGHANSDDHTNPSVHIGKRSAAGIYCWDCHQTLCMQGEEAIHYSGRNEFYDKCPKCGKEPIKEELSESAAGRELGFNKDEPRRKKGVASCCSFTWAMSPDDLCINIDDNLQVPCDFDDHEAIYDAAPVEDEYGRLYTIPEFMTMLKECPVQFMQHIGEHFS